MKTIVAIKMFLVLCCSSYDGSTYKYEVKNLQDTTVNGYVFTPVKYTEGDTIIFK
jgi:hypothetical protein